MQGEQETCKKELRAASTSTRTSDSGGGGSDLVKPPQDPTISRSESSELREITSSISPLSSSASHGAETSARLREQDGRRSRKLHLVMQNRCSWNSPKQRRAE
ncbi:hypothetical protein ILYODFUR_020987 [Ilyodon furcidens]|uniref:Uncharacterized protein n=1 Tax=Ilyodon furcidens TaxID=33524 RepID=A0ABV0UI66_9TELE